MALRVGIPKVTKGNGSELTRPEWPLDFSPPGSQFGNDPLNVTSILIDLPEALFERARTLVRARAVAIEKFYTWESYPRTEKDKSIEDLGKFDWSPLHDPNESRFKELTSQWQTDTAASSSITEKSMHPAYQQIIGMGTKALPYIFSELKSAPHHWFWALRAITGKDPVKPEHRGNLKAMSEDWLAWREETEFLSHE